MTGGVTRAARPRKAALALICAGVLAAVPSVSAAAPPSRPVLPASFSWFVPHAAPPTWHSFTAVQGTVSVSDPPKLKPLGGSGGALSFAARGPRGAYYAYLNVTPQQGAENLGTWAAYRLSVLRRSAVRVHEDAEANDLPFTGGTGACVIDDYTTRAGANPFHEIACFVEGPHSGSVIVVAAPPRSWPDYAAPFERVISAYRVM
jgi:hypothetical protein